MSFAADRPSHPGSTTPYLRLHHVPVFVRDQDRSLGFYVDRLGFNVVIDFRVSSRGRFVLVAPPDGSALLALLAPQPESPEYQLIGRSGQAVFVAEDVVAQFHVWRERGVRFKHPPETAAWGGTFTSFEDIDGNAFSLVGWDDMTRQIEAGRREAVEKLESEKRAAQELEIAKRVQARLFPQTTPAVRTLSYAGACIQAREVGGDYYDFLELGRQRLGLVIGDISGKGIAAALLMANLQATLRGQSATVADDPQRFLKSVNRLFFGNTTDHDYATLIFAEYDDTEQRLRYANCGHASAILLRADRTVERLASTATVLGLFRDWNCSFEERMLSPGDTVVFYTDGVTESFNDAGEEFGEERLVDVLRRHCQLRAEDLLAAIVREVRQFSRPEPHDDLTLIVAQCTPVGA